MTGEAKVREFLRLGLSLLDVDPAVTNIDRTVSIKHAAASMLPYCFFDVSPIDFGSKPIRYRAPNVGMITLFAMLAEDNPVYWYLCKDLAKRHLDEGVELPEPLRGWTKRVLDGDLTPPRTPARYKNKIRNQQIKSAVRIAVDECGVSATRNDASAVESGCDIVSRCLEEHGVYLDYSSVKTIYNSAD